MGLLLGHHIENERGIIAVVRKVLVLQRKEKKKDRVEVGYENLALASTIAENLSNIEKCDNDLKVLGWYHSHPHITVLPSHVDVKTQGSYQQLDRSFLGLILSVGNKGTLEICAYQSKGMMRS